MLPIVAEHKKSLGAVLSAGLARGHRGSPAAALRVHQLHCTPVLFSGLAPLVLNNTGRQSTWEAILHLRQLSLFSMICHLPDDPLHHHANFVLTNLPPSSSSWFHQVRDICLQYGLPHPLSLLQTVVPKSRFKRMVKLKVTEYWQHALAEECTSPSLSSLCYFDPYRASLQHPHQIWTSSAGNSFECSKSTVLARMVSGRYRTEMLCRF